MRLLRFKANIARKPRIRFLEGRPHYVFPVRIWRKGVLTGNDNHGGGSTYFPGKEIKKVVKAWNHVPVVLAHPKRNGKWVSARHPKILNKQKVGILLHNKWDGEFQHAEAWIDKRRVHRLEPRFKKYIKRGFTFEVSTGVNADCFYKDGNYEGSPYDQVARNLEPDHLAILMDQVGACSVAKGCGMFTASKGISPKKMKRVQDAITNAWSGKSSHCSCNQRKEKSMKTKKRGKKLSKREKVATLINARVGWKKKDKGWLKDQEPDVLDRLLVQATKLKPVNTKLHSPSKPDKPISRRRREEDEDADSFVKPSRKKKGGKKKGKKDGKNGKKSRLANSGKGRKMLSRILSSMTPAQIVKAMPGQVGEMFSNGLKAHGHNRRRLIDIIVSADNSDFEKKELLDERRFPLKTLKRMAKLAANQSSGEEQDDQYAPFMGIPGAPIANASRQGRVKQDALPMPRMPISNKRRAKSK